MIPLAEFTFMSLVLVTTAFGSAFSYESSQRVRLTESETVDLLFQFDFEPDVDIQIRIGNRRPFYRSETILEAGLRENQKARFNVEVENNEPYHMILVRVIITSVSREDEGTFICDMLKDGEVLLEHSRRIGVSVDFPPGRATCRQQNHHIDNSKKIWALIKCSATAGSDYGMIECYQLGERMPPWARAVQGETNLTQIIWMRKSSHIYCCASSINKPKEMCNCNDFIWDPVTMKEIKNGPDPCTETLNTPSSTLPTERSAIYKESTPPITEPEEILAKSNEDTGDPVQVPCYEDCGSHLNLVRANFTLICLNTLFLVLIIGVTFGKIHIKPTHVDVISDHSKEDKNKEKEIIKQDDKDKLHSNIRLRNNLSKGNEQNLVTGGSQTANVDPQQQKSSSY